MKIRKAVIKDIKTIHQILNMHADKGLLLHRSLSELYDHLRDYVVVEDLEKGPEVLGVCGLGICWEDLAEIKSLAVVERNRGSGLGRALVQACLEEARLLKIERIFALTYIPKFFEKLGFREVEKTALPHKVWADCIKCPKFPECDETALMAQIKN